MRMYLGEPEKCKRLKRFNNEKQEKEKASQENKSEKGGVKIDIQKRFCV
jgi:hypothetical protein